MSRQDQTNAHDSRAGISHVARVIAVLLPIPIGLALVAGNHFENTASASTVVQAKDRLKDAQFIAEGARLFAPTCGNAYCHGTGGAGGGAPRLRGKDLEAAYVFKSISNGIPGTSMPSFKSELSEEQIWRLVAFIAADAKTSGIVDPPTNAPPTSTPNAGNATPETIMPSSLVGSSQAGKALFFDSTREKSCHACHSFQGEGTPVGPDLSAAASRPAKDLFLSIILPHRVKDARYAKVTVALRNGDTIVGVKKEEDAESLQVYDAAELPVVLRTVQKSDVAKIEYSSESVMPRDYALTYTIKQLLDLVTYLKSAQSKSTVTLTDLVQ